MLRGIKQIDLPIFVCWETDECHPEFVCPINLVLDGRIIMDNERYLLIQNCFISPASAFLAKIHIKITWVHHFLQELKPRPHILADGCFPTVECGNLSAPVLDIREARPCVSTNVSIHQRLAARGMIPFSFSTSQQCRNSCLSSAVPVRIDSKDPH